MIVLQQQHPPPGGCAAVETAALDAGRAWTCRFRNFDRLDPWVSSAIPARWIAKVSTALHLETWTSNRHRRQCWHAARSETGSGATTRRITPGTSQQHPWS